MIKKIGLVLTVLLAFVGSVRGQNPAGSGQPLTLFSLPPQPGSQQFFSISGTAGNTTAFYWLIWNYPGGQAMGPAIQINTVPNTLNGSNFVTIGCNMPVGSTSVDLLKTTTNVAPIGTNTVALSTANASCPISDTGGGLSSYTLTIPAPQYLSFRINSSSYSLPSLDFSIGPNPGSGSGVYTQLLQNNGLIPVTNDGYLFIEPSNCEMALTTGTFAANPANSGGQSAPALVRAASSNYVLQLTTTAAANTTDVTCDITPSTRLTAGRGVVIKDIVYLFGYQTTALTSIGTAAINTITYPVPGGSPIGTVAAVPGSLTVTVGTSHSTPGAVTTTGQCYSEKVALNTPLSLVSDNTRLVWQNTFVQSGAAATVMQICGTIVHYTNAASN